MSWDDKCNKNETKTSNLYPLSQNLFTLSPFGLLNEEGEKLYERDPLGSKFSVSPGPALARSRTLSVKRRRCTRVDLIRSKELVKPVRQQTCCLSM